MIINRFKKQEKRINNHDKWLKASDEFCFCVIDVIHFDVFFHCRFSLSLTKLFLDLTDAWRNPTNALTKDVCKNDVMIQWKEYFFCFSSSFMRMKLHILLFKGRFNIKIQLELWFRPYFLTKIARVDRSYLSLYLNV